MELDNWRLVFRFMWTLIGPFATESEPSMVWGVRVALGNLVINKVKKCMTMNSFQHFLEQGQCFLTVF